MSKTRIDGKIEPKAYLHVKYDIQRVDGQLLTPWDIVITPDEYGRVSFTLPQGVDARIEFWSERNGDLEKVLQVTVPRVAVVALADLESR